MRQTGTLREIKRPPENMQMVSLRMRKELIQRLHSAAKAHGSKYNEYIRILLDEGLKRVGY